MKLNLIPLLDGRLDSDIVLLPRYARREQPLPPSTEEFAKGKTKLAAWFVSNCHTSSKREEFVAELEKHAPIDIYGGCGTCSRVAKKLISID